MISNQVLQNTLEGLREISRTEFCIIDTDGKTLASTYSEFEIQPQDDSGICGIPGCQPACERLSVFQGL